MAMEWQQFSFSEQLQYAAHQFTTDQLCDLLLVDRQTVKRWKVKDNAPQAARRLHWIAAHGYVPDSWHGCYFGPRDHRLYVRTGHSYSQADIEALFYERQLTSELKRSNRRLERQVNDYKFFYTPANDATG